MKSRCESHAGVNPEHRRKLRGSALSDQQIDELVAAGIRSDSKGQLVIPYRHPDGSPQTMADGSPWVRWRLPQWKIDANPDGPKYLSKKDAGCRLYHPVLSPNHANRLGNPDRPLRITEGELKAEACAVHDSKRVTISLGGVDSWRDKRSGQSEPLPELQELPLKGREVRLCFDSDLSKPSVFAALSKFAIWLDGQGAKVLIERLPNAPERDSKGEIVRLGADDLIHHHGVDGFREICRIAQPGIEWKEGKDGQLHPHLKLPYHPEPDGGEATYVRSVYLTALLGRYWQSDSEKPDSWRRWTGTHWEQVDGTDAINRAVEQFLDCQDWRVARSRANVAGLVAAFRRRLQDASKAVAIPGLLPFRNGCLRLADGVLLPHDPAHGNTWALPYDYNPAATCPRIEAFLYDRLEDPANVALYRAFAKTLVTGEPTKNFLEFIGAGNTGKTVLALLLKALVGEGNTASGTLQRLEDRSQRFETLKFRGKRLALFPECRDYSGSVEVLKKMTGGDPIDAEIKGGRHLDFTFTGGVVLVANAPIRASDPSGAVINRRRSLRVDKVVRHADERVLLKPDGHGGWYGELAAELPGMVNWCLAMPAAEARDALARDVRNMARAEAELETLLSTDLLAEWADQHLIWEPGCPAADALRVGMADGDYKQFMFPSYLRFVEGQGRNTRPLSVKNFKSKLVDLLRDTLGLPLPPGSVNSGEYRINRVGSVVPYLRFRREGEDDPNGVIRHAFMARLEAPEAQRIEAEAQWVDNGKNPVGNGWNGCNGSDQLSPKADQSDVAPSRGRCGAPSVPSVPSIAHKGSERSPSVPDPFTSVPHQSATTQQTLLLAHEPVGSGADAFADDDDPAWGPRPSAA